MSEVLESVFMRSLRRQPVERTPIWIMRQAGRYLPEYREVRKKAGDFLSLCKNQELACEVTLQPLRRFELDAAILFSDILTIPDAMGLGLYFAEGEGPKFRKTIRRVEDVEQLPIPDVHDELAYVLNAVRTIRQEMPKHLPLIGFSGSPWTLAAYMVEGQSTRDFKHLLHMMYQTPDVMHALLDKLAQSVSSYLSGQAEAGANALMLFDTWGGILSPQNYRTFSLHYMSQIVSDLKRQYPDIPIILFTKNGGHSLISMAASGCDALGLDWTSDLSVARAAVGDKVALQGNLDPAILRTSKECIREQVKMVLNAYGSGTGHIFNLGHGITPDVPVEHVQALVKAVHEFSPSFHQENNDHNESV